MLILANRLDGGLDDSLFPHSTVVRPHVSDVSSQLMSSPYCSLPVRFDRTFFQNIFGDHFLPFATIPKDSALGISFCLLHYPQDFHQLVKPPSLGASLGGEF